jgi:ATPase family associated with various cellular activities (AAA)
MNAPGPLHDWTEANRQLLVAEFARLKALLAGEPIEEARQRIEMYRAALAAPAAIDQLSERFGLSTFERDVLLLAAGVEMDSALAALCASGAGGRGAWATFGMALAVLPEPHWSALTPMRPLRRWRLVEAEEGTGLVAARLRIDERVLHFIAGVNGLDMRLRPLLRVVPEPATLADAQHAAGRALVDALARQPEQPAPPLVQLWGNDAHGQCDVATHVAARAGLTLYAMAAADMPAAASDAEALATLWDREAALLDGALLVELGDASAAMPGVRRFLEQATGLVLVALREPLALDRDDLRQRIDKPDGRDQWLLWQRLLDDDSAAAQQLADAGAGFRLSAHDVRRVAARLRTCAGDPVDAQREYCRELACRRLDGLAQRIAPSFGWLDLVLPPPQLQALRQIASHVQHRATVYERWGFAAQSARGLGLAVLFAGDSGTGKTMAAEVLARELGLDLFRIDLASVVSKYIGETEKNLARVFDAAEDGGAILLFDEADALFGRRSEVKDSHDRYANIEVSYLLQRMEAYRGLAILTTNQKTALDTAFQRRLRMVVNFPFPDATERREIWCRVFPAATPTAGLDPAKLARLHMSGGQIRNIAVNAAFHAAEAGEPVGMAHLLRAAHTEAAKRERPIADAEIRGWA